MWEKEKASEGCWMQVSHLGSTCCCCCCCWYSPKFFAPSLLSRSCGSGEALWLLLTAGALLRTSFPKLEFLTCLRIKFCNSRLRPSRVPRPTSIRCRTVHLYRSGCGLLSHYLGCLVQSSSNLPRVPLIPPFPCPPRPHPSLPHLSVSRWKDAHKRLASLQYNSFSVNQLSP